MKKVKEPDITVDRCSECGGTFLDKGELDILATGMAGKIEFCSIDEKEQDDKHPIRTCPKPACQNNRMRKIDLLVYSDTIFDYCEKCGGFFLDKGEIEQMNVELENINQDKTAEEFRDYIDNNLVRFTKISGAMSIAFGPLAAGAQAVDYLRISVFFQKPLELGLRIYSEKWTDKFIKAIGLFKKQDLTIGNDDIDKKFIIQADEKEKAIALLARPEIQQQLLSFQNKRFKMFVKPGTLEIVDKRVVYTEGPYTGELKYDVRKDPIGIVKTMLDLAKSFE